MRDAHEVAARRKRQLGRDRVTTGPPRSMPLAGGPARGRRGSRWRACWWSLRCLLTALLLVFSTLRSALGGAGAVRAWCTETMVSRRWRSEKFRRSTWLCTRQAAQRYGLDWAILAGIGKVECDHGRDPDPSCTRRARSTRRAPAGRCSSSHRPGRGTAWTATATAGPTAGILRMRSTRRQLPARVGRSGRLRGRRSRLQPRELVRGRGRELGAPVSRAGGRRRTQLASDEASEGEGADAALEGESPTPVRFIAGERAVLAPGDGSPRARARPAPRRPYRRWWSLATSCRICPTVREGIRIRAGRYEEDCSSTVNYVLYRSGVRGISEIVRDNPLAQDYVELGGARARTVGDDLRDRRPDPHVFMVIAGLRLDTSHNGTDVGPNRDEGGPRWRILDHIPTWAHWSVRHPPGL